MLQSLQDVCRSSKDVLVKVFFNSNDGMVTGTILCLHTTQCSKVRGMGA